MKKSLALTDTLFSPCLVNVNLFYAKLCYDVFLSEIPSHCWSFIESSVTVRRLTPRELELVQKKQMK